MSTKIRATLVDGVTRVRILIRHPMHTGRQREVGTGALIPPHYIKRLTVSHQGHMIIDCQLSTAVSRDPYFAFQFFRGAEGDEISVAWEDNLGGNDRQQTVIRRSGVE